MNQPTFINHRQHQQSAHAKHSPIYIRYRKRKRRAVRKTLERHLLDILLAILLFVGIATGMRAKLRHSQREANRPTTTDLHQQQAMVDYHHTQGRELIFR